MRIQAICLVLVIVLLCPLASAQGIQTNGLNDRQVPHLPLMRANVSQETPRGLLGLPTQHLMRPDFKRWTDSVRARSMGVPIPDERFIPNSIQSSLL